MIRTRPSHPSAVPLLHAVPAEGGPAGPVIVCPWAAGLRLPEDVWLSILPIHDANAWVESPEPIAWHGTDPERVFFGVFALDKLRSPARIFAALRARGVRGIVNLPSVGFFDGAAGEHMRALDYAVDHELAFLREAAQAGFRVAAFTDRTGAIAPADRRLLAFILTGNPEDGLSLAP